MKLGCVLLILLILVIPVNAELLISCNKDIDCALVSQNTCFKGFCQSSIVKPFLGLNDFMLKEENYRWDVLSMNSKTSEFVCDVEGCISFAPTNEKSKFLYWLFYVQ